MVLRGQMPEQHRTVLLHRDCLAPYQPLAYSGQPSPGLVVSTLAAGTDQEGGGLESPQPQRVLPGMLLEVCGGPGTDNPWGGAVKGESISR